MPALLFGYEVIRGVEPEFEIMVDYATDAAGVPAEADVAAWVRAALEGEREAAEVSVRVVDEGEGRELNRAWRERDYATNVLSFPAELPAGVESSLLGDLVVCAPVVGGEAREQGKALEAHWAHMIVHGTLHLLGHDHQSDSEAEAMEALERRILGRLGYPDPYLFGPDGPIPDSDNNREAK